MTVPDLTYLTDGEVDLCVRDRGEGVPLVFLHGTTGTLGVWDQVVDLLPSGVRTIAVDQRGHGRSGKPATGYSADDYCVDLRGLITQLGCGQVVVVGHSLGARNGVVLGARHPELVRGVVAVDYTPYVESQVLDDLDVRVRGGDRQFASREEIEDYLRDRYPLMLRSAVRGRVVYGYTRTDAGYRPLADPTAMVQTVEGLRHDFADEMRDIRVPVTLVRGELSKIVSAEAFAATRTLRPDVRAVEVPDVDHYIPEESPETVASEIERLLSRPRHEEE